MLCDFVNHSEQGNKYMITYYKLDLPGILIIILIDI